MQAYPGSSQGKNLAVSAELSETMKVKDIAEKLGVSETTVGRARRVRGVGRKQTRATPKMKQRIRELYQTTSDSKIGKMIGLSKTNVRKIRMQEGLKSPRSRN